MSTRDNKSKGTQAAHWLAILTVIVVYMTIFIKIIV